MLRTGRIIAACDENTNLYEPIVREPTGIWEGIPALGYPDIRSIQYNFNKPSRR